MRYVLIASLAVVGLFVVLGTLRSATPQAPSQNAAEVKVTEKGFEPPRVKLRPNVPAQITFLRQTDKTCATSVVIPDYNIKRELPLNKPVVVSLTPKTGEISFACGMNMLKGDVVVQEQ